MANEKKQQPDTQARNQDDGNGQVEQSQARPQSQAPPRSGGNGHRDAQRPQRDARSQQSGNTASPLGNALQQQISEALHPVLGDLTSRITQTCSKK
ncbi:MAG TPA: hypothetical protein VKU87_10315 [Thermomicrobiaceae bacterium]|nr:hypothetical protein [Thermomicrobiaceae bacterium]